MIAVSIDSTRIPVYLYTQWPEVVGNWPVLVAAAASAYLGTLLGQRLVGRVSQAAFKRWVNGMIFAFGLVMVAQGSWQATASVESAVAATLLAPAAALWLITLQRRLARREDRDRHGNRASR